MSRAFCILVLVMISPLPARAVGPVHLITVPQETIRAWKKAGGRVTALDVSYPYKLGPSEYGVHLAFIFHEKGSIKWGDLPAFPLPVRVLIRESRFKEEDAKGLARFKNVRSLTCYLQRFEKGTIAGIGTITKLEELRIQYSLGGLDDEGTKHIARLTNLRLLEIMDKRVTGKGLVGLAKLPHLAELSLGGASLSDEGMEHLAGCKSLRVLSLTGPLTDASVKHLAHLKGLRELIIKESKLSVDGTAALRKALPDCEIDVVR